MIKVDCENCKKRCCGQIKNIRPVLIPSEERRFRKNAKTVRTKFRNMLVLKRKKNGACIFFDCKTKKCKIYPKRPLECRLYPLLLDFSKGKARVLLDKRYCPSLKTLKADVEKIQLFISQFSFPEDWIKAHSTMDDY